MACLLENVRALQDHIAQLLPLVDPTGDSTVATASTTLFWFSFELVPAPGHLRLLPYLIVIVCNINTCRHLLTKAATTLNLLSYFTRERIIQV